jgi:subtilisin family serine protease
MSDDLRDAVQISPNGLVPVIITTSSKPTAGLWGLIMSHTGSYQSFNRLSVIAVKLPGFVVAALSLRSDVVHVSLDRPTNMTGHLETTSGAAEVRNYGPPGTVQLDGSGIGIAILDSGIDSSHHSFGAPGQPCRVIANIDFTGEGTTQDLYGHGTHVASIAAGSDHVAAGAYTGIAPGANLINVRVLGAQGQGSASATIAGIDWCITNKSVYNIKVMNLSLGTTAVEDAADDPICQAVQQAVNAGIVVCAAAGNEGKDAYGNEVYGGVHSPGICPYAITVGAANTYQTDARFDDGVDTYSSRGPTRGYYTDIAGVKHYDNLIKPDLVAPGNKIIDAEAAGNYLVTSNPAMDAGVSSFAPHKMMRMSGTSMATPAVAGAVALMLEENPALTPNLIKAILEYTAQPLVGFNNLEQGAGELNIEGAVRLGSLVRSDFLSQPLGCPLLVGAAPSQMTTIAGYTFQWGGGIIQKWNFISGIALITAKQGIYNASGVALSDGVDYATASGVLLADINLLTQSVILSDGVLTATGIILSDGTLQAQGTVLADGIVLSDGGHVVPDGVIISDSVLSLTGAAGLAQAASTNSEDPGDSFGRLDPVVDR